MVLPWQRGGRVGHCRVLFNCAISRSDVGTKYFLLSRNDALTTETGCDTDAVPISPYVLGLREKVGHALVLLPGVAGLIYDDAGRVLLMCRSDDGTWDLPAGGIEPGESPRDAVVREVAEETGLDVVPEDITAVLGPRRSTYPNGDIAEYTVVVFRCRVVGGELSPVDGEAAELRWFSRSEIPASASYPATALFPGADEANGP